MVNTRTSVTTVALGALLGLAGMILIYGHEIGLGFTLFSVILLSALLIYARTRHISPKRGAMLLFIPILFFSAMLTVRAQESLIWLNLSAEIMLSLLLIYFFNSGNIADQSIFDYALKALAAGMEVWLRPLTELNGARRWLSERNGQWGAIAPIMRGLVLTVPLVAIFVVLLSSADEVFSQLVGRIINGLVPHDLTNLSLQTAVVGILGWLAIGGLASAMVERKVKREGDAPPDAVVHAPTLTRWFRIGFTEAIMALGGVCIVFAAFVVIQFVYLFGGQHNITNYSYAEYVHRGFLELVVVAVLTLGVVFTLHETTTRSTRRHENLFRSLSVVLIVLTSVILVSAFQRMHLYESTYGLTALRLEIYVFIAWLGFLFAGFTLSLFWQPRSINVFGVCLLSALIGFAGTLDVLNPDAFVTWQNIQRGDIDHLSTLSVEAVPALTTLIDAPEPGLRAIVHDTLNRQLIKLDDEIRTADWRDFNLDRANAMAALQPLRDRLNAVDNFTYRANTIAPTKHDFEAFLKRGMTVRAVARQFGTPGSTSGSPESVGRNSPYTLYYSVVEGELALSFDTETGLERACFATMPNSCLDLPPQ